MLAKNRTGRVGLILFSFCIGLVLFASCHKKTEEDIILELIDTLARLAEKKDLETIMTYFADDFSDFEGRDKPGLKALLAGYFSGRTGIVVHPLSSRIDALEFSQASLETEVALSSGGAEALRRLVKISPDNYRIKIGLVKDGTSWLIQSAEWSYISLDELFPESLTVLKKIFPNL